MRIAIMTSSRRGSASNCLPSLAEHPDIEVALVIHCRAQYASRRRRMRRDLQKIRRIGLGGALVGYYMRGWYAGEPKRDLAELCEEYRIPFASSPRTNADETVRLLRDSGADLGVSLGNGLIFPKVYRVPTYGMVNVHGEVLPRFQGAASVIWAIHEGIAETGFTIHEVARSIDTGRILYQERFPLVFEDTMEKTVRRNVAEIGKRVPPALAAVLADFPRYRDKAQVQEGGQSYTTPSLRQFLQMRRQFQRLRAEAGRTPS